jgi:hypothetical protein
LSGELSIKRSTPPSITRDHSNCHRASINAPLSLIRAVVAAITSHSASVIKRARHSSAILSGVKPPFDPQEVVKLYAKLLRDYRAMEDAAFTRDRLSTALSRLQQRLEQLRAFEEDARRHAAYEKAKAERDQLAAELAELYPAFADKLADLLARIDDNDRDIAYVNGRLSSDARPLLVAELVARGLEGFVQDGLSTPSITRQLRLLAFKRCPSAPYAWPRSETERPNAMISAIVALMKSHRFCCAPTP